MPRHYFIIVCEDQSHEMFVRRFLKEVGLVAHRSQIRVKRARNGRGAAEQFVRSRFISEIESERRSHVNQYVIVVMDGDRFGVSGRLRQLDEACDQKEVRRRDSKDRVAVFIPTWNIETWFAYLDGSNVDEELKDYPELDKKRIQACVQSLADMCRERKLREPAPESLFEACLEYDQRLRPLRQ